MNSYTADELCHLHPLEVHRALPAPPEASPRAPINSRTDVGMWPSLFYKNGMTTIFKIVKVGIRRQSRLQRLSGTDNHTVEWGLCSQDVRPSSPVTATALPETKAIKAPFPHLHNTDKKGCLPPTCCGPNETAQIRGSAQNRQSRPLKTSAIITVTIISMSIWYCQSLYFYILNITGIVIKYLVPTQQLT